MAVRSKTWVCNCLIAGIAGSSLAEGNVIPSLVFVVCCVGSGLWDGLIIRSGEYYRVCVCVCVCLIVCDLDTATLWRPRPEFGLLRDTKKLGS